MPSIDAKFIIVALIAPFLLNSAMKRNAHFDHFAITMASPVAYTAAVALDWLVKGHVVYALCVLGISILLSGSLYFFGSRHEGANYDQWTVATAWSILIGLIWTGCVLVVELRA